jgi:hypothetical protein
MGALAMSWKWSIRLQTARVIALFFGAFAAVLYNTLQALLLPTNELELRARLGVASQRIADAAQGVLQNLQPDDGHPFVALNRSLRAISNRVLMDYPGVEGGFYLDAPPFDRFAGYGFPTERAVSPAPPAVAPPAPRSKPPVAGSAVVQPPAPFRGDDPPPKEIPFIYVQVKHSLSLDRGR